MKPEDHWLLMVSSIQDLKKETRVADTSCPQSPMRKVPARMACSRTPKGELTVNMYVNPVGSFT